MSTKWQPCQHYTSKQHKSVGIDALGSCNMLFSLFAHRCTHLYFIDALKKGTMVSQFHNITHAYVGTVSFGSLVLDVLVLSIRELYRMARLKL